MSTFSLFREQNWIFWVFEKTEQHALIFTKNTTCRDFISGYRLVEQKLWNLTFVEHLRTSESNKNSQRTVTLNSEQFLVFWVLQIFWGNQRFPAGSGIWLEILLIPLDFSRKSADFKLTVLNEYCSYDGVLGCFEKLKIRRVCFCQKQLSKFPKIRGRVQKPHACSEIYWTTMLLHGWGWFMRKMALPGIRPHTKPTCRCTNALTTLKISVPYDYYF